MNTRIIPAIIVALGLTAMAVFGYEMLPTSKFEVGKEQVGVVWPSPGLPPVVYMKPGRYPTSGGYYVYNNVPRAYERQFDVLDIDEKEWTIIFKFEWVIKDPVRFFQQFHSIEQFEQTVDSNLKAHLTSMFPSMSTATVRKQRIKIAKILTDAMMDYPIAQEGPWSVTVTEKPNTRLH